MLSISIHRRWRNNLYKSTVPLRYSPTQITSLSFCLCLPVSLCLSHSLYLCLSLSACMPLFLFGSLSLCFSLFISLLYYTLSPSFSLFYLNLPLVLDLPATYLLGSRSNNKPTRLSPSLNVPATYLPMSRPGGRYPDNLSPRFLLKSKKSTYVRPDLEFLMEHISNSNHTGRETAFSSSNEGFNTKTAIRVVPMHNKQKNLTMPVTVTQFLDR